MRGKLRYNSRGHCIVRASVEDGYYCVIWKGIHTKTSSSLFGPGKCIDQFNELGMEMQFAFRYIGLGIKLSYYDVHNFVCFDKYDNIYLPTRKIHQVQDPQGTRSYDINLRGYYKFSPDGEYLGKRMFKIPTIRRNPPRACKK